MSQISKSENVGKKTRNYIFFYAALILFMLWGDDFIRLLTVTMGKKGDLEFTQKLAVSVVTVLGALSIITTDLSRDLALHLVLDSLIFKVRKRVNAIIIQQMTEKARLSAAEGWQTVMGKDAIDVFWHFVNKQAEGLPSSNKGGVLSERAHRLFEQYYTNIYALSLGCLGFIVATIIAFARGKLDVIAFTPTFFMLIVLSLAASTKWMLLKNIYSVPGQQIKEIGLSELKKEIERRYEEIVIARKCSADDILNARSALDKLRDQQQIQALRVVPTNGKAEVSDTV